jgi:hypothetical protein
LRAALLLCALAAPPAPGVRPLPAGGELITLPLAGPAWTEVRVALRTPADPPDRAGLGARWWGLILAARLGAEPTLAPTAAVTRSVEGLVVAFGAPPEEVPAALEAVLAALAPRPLGAAEVDAAVAAAVAARQDGLRDGAQLVQATLRRALSEQGPAEGEVVGLAEVTLADAQAALTGLTRRGGPGVVLVGRLPALGPVLASLEAARAAWGTAAGPEPTPAGARRGAGGPGEPGTRAASRPSEK